MKFKIAGVVVIAVMLCAMAAEYGKRDKPQEAAVVVTDTYVVMAGDTLWSIADEFCPEGVDKREYIDDLRVHNRIDSAAIYPGQEIEIWIIENCESGQEIWRCRNKKSLISAPTDMRRGDYME